MASPIMLMITPSLLDVSAFCLALTAEFTRSTASEVVDNGLAYKYCVYSSKIATLFAICALLCVIGSQFLRCFYKIKGSPTAWALLFFAISWVSFVEAVVFLVMGSVLNAKRTNSRWSVLTDDATQPFCETLRKGVFAAGAAFALTTAITFNLSYVCHCRAMASREPSNEVHDRKKSLISEP